MKLILTCILFIGCIPFSQSQKYSRVKVFANQQELLNLSNLGVPTDHGMRKKNTFLISDFSENEIQIMADYGFSYEVQIDDVKAFYKDRLSKPNIGEELKNEECDGASGGASGGFDPGEPNNFNLGSMGGYLTYDEMLDELDAMHDQYPNIITPKTPISNFQTDEGRPIYHVRMSDNPSVNESGEPNVLYSAIHHAREPMSLMETIFFMWYLLENYGSDPEATFLIDHSQLFFVPCLNPDGYIYNEITDPNGGGMWRKNRRDHPNSNNYGVDLNRNYSYGWGTTGISFNTNSDVYCGTGPFSEPETQAMKWLAENYDFETAFNAHSYSPAILFPIGTTDEEFAEHHDYIQAYSNHMCEFNGYPAYKSSGLYPASGDSDDYLYKVDIGEGEKDTIFAHTPEVGSSFWPGQGDIVPTCQDMVFANLVLAQIAQNYIVVKDSDPSSVASLSGNFNHTAQRYGRKSGNVTVSIEPLTNIAAVGNPIVYNLNQLETQNGSFSYSLNSSIQFGDVIKYVLKTDNGLWIKRDTITKTYGSITLQVYDDASNTNNWSGNWYTTNATYVSPNRSFTDSPNGNYSNNSTKNFTYDFDVDLTNAISAMVSFYAKWDIEADYDYVQFQVSTNGGNSWIGQCGNYTVPGTDDNGSVQPDGEPVYEGVYSDWVLEEISLSDYLGETIKLRFRLQSDGGVREDGFYFDDFKIFYNEAPLGTPPVASFTPSAFESCEGESVDFTDFSTEQPTNWAWDFGDGNTSSFQNPSHVFTTPGVYVITMEVTNQFGSNSTVQTVVINENPTVEIQTSDSDNQLCLNESSIQLIGTPSGVDFSGPGVNGTIFNPTAAGVGVHVIQGEYTDANGCTGIGTVEITVDDCVSITDLSYFGVRLYPNPNNGRFMIEGLNKGSFYQVFDMNGRILISGEVVSSVQEIDLNLTSEGVYYIQSDMEGQISRLRFMVLK
jgi:PKD repeat protein